MSHLSRMKNPICYVYMQLQPCGPTTTSCTILFGCLNSLGTTASFSGLLRLGFTMSQLCFANCLLCLVAVTFVSYILTISCVLSLVLTIAIYALPPSPLRPIEGVKGIHPLTTIILKQVEYVVYFGYLLCLSPSQALFKSHHSVKRRQGKPWVTIQAARQYLVVDGE